jgi:hypothetical protein
MTNTVANTTTYTYDTINRLAADDYILDRG